MISINHQVITSCLGLAVTTFVGNTVLFVLVVPFMTDRERMQGSSHLASGTAHPEVAMPSHLTQCFLRGFTLLVDAVPLATGLDPCSRVQPTAELTAHQTAQQTSCRFLLSLFVIDSLSWAAFRIVQFEAIRNATMADSFSDDGFGMSPMVFVSLIVTVESTVEFVASAVTPALYKFATGSRRFEVASLGIFCARAYTLSQACALAVALCFSSCVLDGANSPAGVSVQKCDAAGCSCHQHMQTLSLTPVDCGLSWLNGSDGGRACCIHSVSGGNSEQKYCEVPSGDASSCPLSQTSAAWFFAVCYFVLNCFLNQAEVVGRSCALACLCPALVTFSHTTESTRQHCTQHSSTKPKSARHPPPPARVPGLPLTWLQPEPYNHPYAYPTRLAMPQEKWHRHSGFRSSRAQRSSCRAPHASPAAADSSREKGVPLVGSGGDPAQKPSRLTLRF